MAKKDKTDAPKKARKTKVERYLDSTGRAASEIVRFSDLHALESHSAPKSDDETK